MGDSGLSNDLRREHLRKLINKELKKHLADAQQREEMKGSPVNRWVEEKKKERRHLRTFCTVRGEMPPTIREAICYSDICDKNGCTSGKVIAASIHATDCPVCGHALWWRTRVDYESIEKKKS